MEGAQMEGAPPDQSTWIATGAHKRDPDPAQHPEAQPAQPAQSAQPHPDTFHLQLPPAEQWASEGPHDVRRSPIPEEMEPPERPHPHHEGSQDTIRAKRGPRPPLDHHHPQPPPEHARAHHVHAHRPHLLHEDSGETIRRVTSREHDHDACEPIGRAARDSHSAVHDEPGTLHPSVHQVQHHHHQRKKRGSASQPRPLMPPRRASAGMAIAPDDGVDLRARALNVPQVVQHLYEVQAADVALVNSISALDGKVDRLLRHFGVEVGAVGIHGKLDALMATVGVERE
jgi:hypothetical protein